MFHIKSKSDYDQQYQASIADPQKFWGEVASKYFWFEKWSKVFDCDLLKAKISWFENAKTNISVNCLDRHLESFGNKTAIIWEANNPQEKSQKITYQELHSQTCQFANYLISLGVKKGDRVCIYMPMIPQSVVVMLACARIGAIHCVVFAGFSASALAGRIEDSDSKILITSDVLFRGDKKIDLLEIAKEAAAKCNSIEMLIAYDRENSLDHHQKNFAKPIKSWQQEVRNFSTSNAAEICDAQDSLFILYTSGSTGKPKGIVHALGGYMTYAGYSFKNVFQYQENDIFFCSADIGWITGHSYLVYGPLLNAATILMFEGVPTYPTPARFWEVIEKHKVNIFYTAPTAIRALMQKGDEFVKGHDLSSLKTLGTVGEPINEEAWKWFYKKIGNQKCPIVDTWWQTETGGIMISSMAGVFDSKPSHAGLPLPGIVPVLMDETKKEITQPNKVGSLCLRQPWPGMARGVWNDFEKFTKTYYEEFPNHYFAGDGAFRSDDGLYRIIGRTDDVIKVSGHRLGTAEIENATNSHPQVSESAAISVPHDIKGEGILVFAITKNMVRNIEKEISEIIVKEIGAIARPEKIYLINDLPKTRSGKIMRRVLKKIVAQEQDLGDVSTLVNPDVVQDLRKVFSHNFSS